ncbi:MAG: VWA domain-containing protein [Phycisphaerae bacterium]|nr:VWA domain-containing protein [Phycisphaerae bacterium]
MSRDDKADMQQHHAPHEHTATEKMGAFLGGLILAVISIMFHLGLLLIMLFVVFMTEMEPDPTKIDIVGDAYAEDPGAKLSPTREISKSASQSKSKSRKYTRTPSVNSGAGKTSKAVSVIGTGGAIGDGAAQMGLPVANAGGSKFFGTKSGGNMRNLVYVLDLSGSLLGYFNADIKPELCKSLARLNGEKQNYHVILFAEGKPLEKSPRRLTPATRKSVRETARWLNDMEMSSGATQAIPALERAFAVLKGRKGGSVIYLLTDGSFKDRGGNAKVLEYINRTNKDKKVHVNTFMYGVKPKSAVEVMQKIAKQNAGKYKFVESE